MLAFEQYKLAQMYQHYAAVETGQLLSYWIVVRFIRLFGPNNNISLFGQQNTDLRQLLSI